MIKQFALASCLVLAAIAPASAAVQSYAFTGTIHTMYRTDHMGWFAEELTGTEGPNGGPRVELGYCVSGVFTFDDASEPDYFFESSASRFYLDYANGSLTYTVRETGVTSQYGTETGSLDSRFPQYLDHFSVSSADGSASLWFDDASHQLFANGFPTRPLSLDALSGAVFSASWKRADGANVGYRAHLDTLSLQPIPEPASWGMMLAGLGLLGAAARRARR